MGSILVGQTSELIRNLRPLCHARLLLTGKSQALAVFIDSGSDVSIIDEELVQQLGFQQVRLPQPTRGFVEEEGEASSVEEDEDFQEREAKRAASDEY
ncbi:hypothetical protein NQZ68_022517 [Dissostichus eleginoides]|nr:hypothetical protein NQZ68_022517 [Dissostichus eleginoides]